MEEKGLFNDIKYCEICKRPLPADFEEPICLNCREQALFQKVKEYIRSNDVTEYDVANHFEIPLSKVKHWIREGRIEYKDQQLNARITFNCARCGAQISFGTLCTKCLKSANLEGHAGTFEAEATRMRFLENADHLS